MKKLHILQTPARFYPSIGGVENYVLDLSEELSSNGNMVTVVSANDPKSNIKSWQGIKNVRLSYLFKIANTNITPLLLVKLLSEKFDVIHTHIPTPWSADISMLASYIKRRPLILTYHNDLLKNGASKYIAAAYNATFLRLVLNRSRKIIITSPSYLKKSRYLRRYSDKVVVIPNGVNLEKFKNNSRIKKNDYQIFFLSVLDRHHKYKGLDYLIRSLPDVIKKFPKIELIIGGKGELAIEYKLLVNKLKISNNVNFVGYVDLKTLQKLYQESSIFILPSIDNNEGFGIVLLEAMAYKTPVITTKIVGPADDIEKYKAGIVISPKNRGQMSNAIIKLFDNSTLRKKMGENGRKLVENKYSRKQITERIEQIYREVSA